MKKKKRQPNSIMFLSMAAIVMSVNLAVSLQSKPSIYLSEVYNYHVSPLPVLAKDVTPPMVSAQAVYAQDLDSHVVLYEKNPQGQLLPASTTKILTALVAIDSYNLDDTMTVGNIKVIGQKMGLYSLEKIKIKDVLKGLLIYSGNDAAEALADNFPLGRQAFIDEMNMRAKEIGATNSHFVNPTGLDEANHFSTAEDLVTIATYAMKNPILRDVVSTKATTVTSVDGTIIHHLENTNKLLGSVPGVLGVKTGWTEEARENLVTYIERDGHRVMIATLGSQDRFGESKEIIDWIFGTYNWINISSPQETFVRNIL